MVYLPPSHQHFHHLFPASPQLPLDTLSLSDFLHPINLKRESIAFKIKESILSIPQKALFFKPPVFFLCHVRRLKVPSSKPANPSLRIFFRGLFPTLFKLVTLRAYPYCPFCHSNPRMARMYVLMVGSSRHQSP